jgi:hypothetical protein
MNLFDMLKADKGIPVSDPMARLWGYQYQQKHGVSEISGVPPLHFASRGEQLLDYRIYGNTVQDGTPAPENPAEVQGVGEQTENLFDKDVAVVYNAYILRAGGWNYANDSRSIRIRVKPNTQYTLSTEGRYTIFRILEIQSDDVPTEQNRYPQIPSILIVFGENQSHYTFRTSENAKYIVFQSNLSVVNNWLNELMLVEGNSIRSDYIPYGYKIPVAVTNGTETVTTPVYIGSEPLYLNEYVSYGEQQIYKNINGVLTPIEPPVPIPAITTARGGNILTIETTVQPSNIWIKGKIKAIN